MDEVELIALPVNPSSLNVPRAKSFANTLQSGDLDFVRLIECRRSADPPSVEIVVIEVEVERPQSLANPIQRFERLAIVFAADDDSYPRALSLRKSFPRVKHLNFAISEIPRDLCLYEEPWHEVQVRWTPTNYVERIRSWLSETASGTLHQDDQALEAIFPRGRYQVILPADLFADAKSDELAQLHVVRYANEKSWVVFGCSRTSGNDNPKKESSKTEQTNVVAFAVVAEPQEHGMIRHIPRTLKELDELFQNASINLIAGLRKCIGDVNPSLRGCMLLILAACPLTRRRGLPVEITDIVAFLTASTLEEIGLNIGVWERVGTILGTRMGDPPDDAGAAIAVDLVSPHFDLTRAAAAASSAITPSDKRIAAIGAGALGSQTLMYLQRSGFGQFTVIDEDILLPHNLVRHALSRNHIGFSKADGLAFELERLYPEAKPKWICANALKPNESKDAVEEAFKSADLILDQSASVSLARYLSNGIQSDARRMSLFLNLRGTDLVAIVEDAKRTMRLDCLEMQYYREVSRNPAVADHLKATDSRIRYARSCRDVTAAMPTDIVALQAAIGARAIRTLAENEEAAIRIWRAHPDTLEVKLVEITPAKFYGSTSGEWTIFVSEHVLHNLGEQRQGKLPNETGGVLIGSFDVLRKLVYVVDSLPSPPDSEEWPTLYIRGSKGLLAQIMEIESRTLHQLEYVGEWHSHPDGCRCDPSNDDLKVFAWLTGHMASAGLPALMAIAGQNGQSAWFLATMIRGRGWELVA